MTKVFKADVEDFVYYIKNRKIVQGKVSQIRYTKNPLPLGEGTWYVIDRQELDPIPEENVFLTKEELLASL